MKFLILILLILISTQSCTKEQTTAYSASLENTTAHKIEIKPYIAGIVNSNKIITLLPNSKQEIANGIMPGLNKGGFLSDNFTGADSLLIVFDNLYAIVHYGATPQNLNPRHYLFSAKRNVGNWRNYQITTANVSKHQRENIHVFNFIEQDYLDAK